MKGLFGFLVLLMPLLLGVGWLWLTRLLWRGGRLFIGSTFANLAVRLVVVVIVAAIWFGGAFWEVAGKKLYYDAQVRELCVKDGGVKVYETVTLPAERFDRFGNVHIPVEKKAGPGDEYYYEDEDHYYHNDDPEVVRRQSRIIRRRDGKVLGEYIRYARIGGDLPGPWHGSSFSCPDPRKTIFEPAIFLKGEKK